MTQISSRPRPQPSIQATPADTSAERPRRLALPDTVQGGRILWPYVIPMATLHLLALLAVLPWLFSWAGLIMMLIGVPMMGILGMNICYHRMLSHRSLRAPRWFERVLVFVAICCLEGPPGKWVAMHRYHHGHSDEQPDPHSPLVNFFWAHVGWLTVRNRAVTNIAMYERYAKDILADPFYMKLEKGLLWVWLYLAHAAVIFGVGAAIGAAAGGTWAAALQFGLSLLVWGVILRTVLVWHITWSVNSLTHMFGYRSYKTHENSRNNWVVGLVAAGEGWHNNHHDDPVAASNQRRWWEVDITFYTIKLLQWLGLVHDIVPPRHRRRALREQRQQHHPADT